jgi:plasmid stabilization system protein ParE
LDEAIEYIAQDSPQAAEQVLEVALRTASSLRELSERGRVVPEIGNPKIREVFVYSYRVLYMVADDQVQILAFLHGTRDFERWRRSM